MTTAKSGLRSSFKSHSVSPSLVWWPGVSQSGHSITVLPVDIYLSCSFKSKRQFFCLVSSYCKKIHLKVYLTAYLVIHLGLAVHRAVVRMGGWCFMSRTSQSNPGLEFHPRQLGSNIRFSDCETATTFQSGERLFPQQQMITSHVERIHPPHPRALRSPETGDQQA